MALLRARAPIGQVGYSILVYRADFAWSALAYGTSQRARMRIVRSGEQRGQERRVPRGERAVGRAPPAAAAP